MSFVFLCLLYFRHGSFQCYEGEAGSGDPQQSVRAESSDRPNSARQQRRAHSHLQPPVGEGSRWVQNTKCPFGNVAHQLSLCCSRSNTESHVEPPRNKRRLSGSHAHLLGDSPVEWIPFSCIRGLLDDDQTRPKKQNKTNFKLFSFYLPKWSYFLRISELILIMNIFLLYSFLHTQYVFIPSLISLNVVKSRKNTFGLDWCK